MANTTLVKHVARSLAVEPTATVYPAGSDAFAHAAAALVSGAQAFGYTLDLASPDLLVAWPEARKSIGGTQSLDAFASECLTVPEVGAWFEGATMREPKNEEEAQALAELLERGVVVDEPLVVYALGATLAHYLERHGGARWVGGDSVDVTVDAPPGMRVAQASFHFPFVTAREKLADPRNSLWTKRHALLEAPPPRGLASTIDEARSGLSALLPEGTLALLENWQTLGAEATLRELEASMDRHPDNGLLVVMALPVSGQLEGLAHAERLCRRLCAVHPHVNSRYALADTLGCLEEPAALAEAEALFEEILREQPMMLRARLKLGLLLAETDRVDKAIEHFVQVANSWGRDAEEARSYLGQLGISLEPNGAGES
jgi:hypothetical protein